ncbi:hypothetical protein AMECASPLE_003679 [Ameca splendens]|uniref:Uncharacterized protein n=1 Tax=Ameca splendens TaxID=208324 RepID=A0ABV0XYZ2_9TELE
MDRSTQEQLVEGRLKNAEGVGAWEYCAPLDHQRSPFCKLCDLVTGVPDQSLIVQVFGGVFRSQPPVLQCLSVLPMCAFEVWTDLEPQTFTSSDCILTANNSLGFSIPDCWLSF